eukprot:11178346-Lingulodinium_polyedra.AAC.1
MPAVTPANATAAAQCDHHAAQCGKPTGINQRAQNSSNTPAHVQHSAAQTEPENETPRRSP